MGESNRKMRKTFLSCPPEVEILAMVLPTRPSIRAKETSKADARSRIEHHLFTFFYVF